MSSQAFDYTVENNPLKNYNDSIIIGGERGKMRKLPKEPIMEQVPAKGISKLLGKTITIIGYESKRGQPTKFTKPLDIGTDKLTDYSIIDTLESYPVDDKKISRWFVNPKTIGKYLESAIAENGAITKDDSLIVDVYTEVEKFKNPTTWIKQTPTQEKLSN